MNSRSYIKINSAYEGVHLTLPPHIVSVQVKSGTCYITGQWGASSEQNKHNPNPNSNP